LGWLKNGELQNPFSLRSAYALELEGKVNGERLPFTNVTSGFVGALDYILYEQEDSSLKQIGRLEIPTDFRSLNIEGVANGHLLPSDLWPSDHLCIGAKFSLAPHRIHSIQENQTQDYQTSIPSTYIPEGMSKHMMTLNVKNLKGTNKNQTIETNIPSTYIPEGMSELMTTFNVQDTDGAKQKQTTKTNSSDTPKHTTPQLDCKCGCVPPIPSLFEMAELRKQARLKKEGKL